MSVATLTYLPFPSHRISRKHRTGFYVGAIAFLGGTAAMMVLKPEFFFDLVFFYMAFYSATAWMTLTKAERTDYWRVVAEARQQYRAAAS